MTRPPLKAVKITPEIRARLLKQFHDEQARRINDIRRPVWSPLDWAVVIAITIGLVALTAWRFN